MFKRYSKRLQISFSGGETSAYMTKLLLANYKSLGYEEVVVIFANTTEEREECLEFIDACDRAFGFGTVWVEAVVNPKKGIRAGAKVVTFETASRDGSVFEAMIQKHGIPNQMFKHCTRVLKQDAMTSYMESIGWEPGSYDTAIGIRVDEIDRISRFAEKNKLVYPLVSIWPTTKPQINTHWRGQPFRLRLKGYQGNCKTCWKKTLRKHLTLISETPEIFDFNRRMEEKYGLVGPEWAKAEAGKRPPIPEGYRRVFFRKNRSTDDLFALYESLKDTFIPAEDDAAVFDEELDVGAGCEESCEVFSDEDDLAEA